MKYVFTFLLSIMLVSVTSAQNKEETLKWLNKHIKYVTEASPDGYRSKDFKVEMTESFIKVETKEDGEKYVSTLYWSEIKHTMLCLTSEEKGYVSLSKTEGSRLNITLYLSDHSTEMRDYLTRMANWSGSDVSLGTLDLRGKSIF